MTTTVLLVRHGQTYSNVTGYYMGWSDEGLNEVGYTSPLRRARVTAAILAEPHNPAETRAGGKSESTNFERDFSD